MAAVLLLIICMMLLSILICKSLDIIMSNLAMTSNEDAQWERDMKSPDTVEFERAYGVPIPETLWQLYRNEAIWRLCDIDIIVPGRNEAIYIHAFQPVNSTTIDESQLGLGPRSFAFAVDAFGNLLFIETSEGDSPVFYHDVELNESGQICTTVSDFLDRVETHRMEKVSGWKRCQEPNSGLGS